MPDVRLSNPRLGVTLDDGRVLEVQTQNPDLVRWDRTAAKHGWPSFQTAPFLWVTFLAWSALRRTGQIGEDVTWDTFADTLALSVTNLNNPDDANGSDAAARAAAGNLGDLGVEVEVGDVVPTLPGAVPG